MTRDIARARFQSLCPVCKSDITPGEAISFERSPKAKHWACSVPAAAAPTQPISPWQPYLGSVITVRRGDRTVTGPCFVDRGRWWLRVTYAGYEGRTYYRAFDLRDSDTVVLS